MRRDLVREVDESAGPGTGCGPVEAALRVLDVLEYHCETP